MVRIIEWSYHIERGAIENPTARVDKLQQYLDFFSRYKAIKFVRKNYAARYQIISARSPGIGWMWTRKSTFQTWLHPTVNWGRNAFVFGKCICHEFLHAAGVSNHLPGTEPIMNPWGGTAQNFTVADYAYMSAYPWNGTLRPQAEPTAMFTTFNAFNSPSFSTTLFETQMSNLQHSIEVSGIPLCGGEPNVPWHNWLTRLSMQVVQE